MIKETLYQEGTSKVSSEVVSKNIYPRLTE